MAATGSRKSRKPHVATKARSVVCVKHNVTYVDATRPGCAGAVVGVGVIFMSTTCVLLLVIWLMYVVSDKQNSVIIKVVVITKLSINGTVRCRCARAKLVVIGTSRKQNWLETKLVVLWLCAVLAVTAGRIMSVNKIMCVVKIRIMLASGHACDSLRTPNSVMYTVVVACRKSNINSKMLGKSIVCNGKNMYD